MDWANDLQTLLTSISQKIGPVLIALALSGTLSMALVQVLKVFGQTIFQRFALFQWLGYGANPFLSHKGEALLEEMVFLAIGQRSHLNVLCGLDLPKMMGQLQAASKMAIDNPEKYSHVYNFFVTTDIESDVKTSIAKDACAWKDSVKDRRTSPKASSPSQTQNLGSSQAGTSLPLNPAEDRSRIANLVSRKLDGFQLRTDFWWQTTCQATAILISIALCTMALHGQFVLGFLGGLLAPFIKDLSSTVTSLAKK